MAGRSDEGPIRSASPAGIGRGPVVESSPLRVFLFRAAQELLFNVVKHSGVKTAQVVLSGSGSRLVMTVGDQGQGFTPDTSGFLYRAAGFRAAEYAGARPLHWGQLVIESSRARVAVSSYRSHQPS